MAKEDQSETAAQTESAAPKKSKVGLILIVLVILMAGVAGFFGWQYFKGSKANASAQADSSHGEEEVTESPKPKHEKGKSPKSGHKEEASDGATINFEPFLVNLADKDASRYLRATIRVVVSNKETAERITSGEVLISKIRDAVLNILCTKISTDIVTSEGKEKLKKEILEKLNSFIPEQPAQDVFFTDFVVQL